MSAGYIPIDKSELARMRKPITRGTQYPWRLPDFRLAPQTFDKDVTQPVKAKDILKKQGL